jgi:hypothetical protein
MANEPKQARRGSTRCERGRAQPRREHRSLNLRAVTLTTDVPDQLPVLPNELDLLDAFFADLIEQARSSSA